MVLYDERPIQRPNPVRVVVDDAPAPVKLVTQIPAPLDQRGIRLVIDVKEAVICVGEEKNFFSKTWHVEFIHPVYSRLAGYEDTNDAERLADDPTMRVVVGDRGIDRPAASASAMSRFETEVLTQDSNVEGLGRVNAKWVDGAMSRTPHRRVILDMDSSESPVHGEQERASYNGHFGSMCYHPLFVFNQFGDCEGAMLRPGNVHSAHNWREVLDPIVVRYGAAGVRRYFRADAAFAKPDIYEYLEERRVFYAIRLPSNTVLQWEIAPLLIRPVGRPPKRPVIRYDDFWYRAGSWDRARRVVAKVEWHGGELFPRMGFIVTNMSAGPEGVVHFYNGRGTAEQWIKEGNYIPV